MKSLLRPPDLGQQLNAELWVGAWETLRTIAGELALFRHASLKPGGHLRLLVSASQTSQITARLLAILRRCLIGCISHSVKASRKLLCQLLLGLVMAGLECCPFTPPPSLTFVNTQQHTF
eukprot:6207118-Pleurochrysis_carterae.AAC.1